jgi:hypothetical protein
VKPLTKVLPPATSGAGRYYVVESTLQNNQCHAQPNPPSSPGCTWVIGYVYGQATTTINRTANVWVNGQFWCGGSASGVITFNGRNGPVVPQIGDYQALLLTNGALLSAPFSTTDVDGNFILIYRKNKNNVHNQIVP